MPYVQYGGWFSCSIARAQVLKVGGELTSFQAVNYSILFLCERDPPFILQGGTPLVTYLYRGVLSL